MSNLLFSGYSFQNELITRWFLQNLLPPQIGETQEMVLQLLNNQANGYEIVTQTLQGQSPSLIFRSIINNTETQLFKYDISSSKFIFNFGITGLPNPVDNLDAVNKVYIDTKTWDTSQITNYTANTNSLISSASISPSQLVGYPGTSTTYLKGDGSWANFATTATTAALTLRLDQFAVPTNPLNLNTQRIQNLQDPLSTNPQDAATKNYVDQVVAGISGGLPIGAMTMWCSETLPLGGWLECNGSAISRTTYASLFAVLGTRWGQGDGSTTFNLPDTRGLFPRGWNHGTTKPDPYNDPNASSRIASGTGGVTGDHVGTLQPDDYQAHSHTYQEPGTSNAVNGLGSVNVANPRSSAATGTSPTSGGSETRPVNFSVMFIIKAL